MVQLKPFMICPEILLPLPCSRILDIGDFFYRLEEAVLSLEKNIRDTNTYTITPEKHQRWSTVLFDIQGKMAEARKILLEEGVSMNEN